MNRASLGEQRATDRDRMALHTYTVGTIGTDVELTVTINDVTGKVLQYDVTNTSSRDHDVYFQDATDNSSIHSRRVTKAGGNNQTISVAADNISATQKTNRAGATVWVAGEIVGMRQVH